MLLLLLECVCVWCKEGRKKVRKLAAAAPLWSFVFIASIECACHSHRLLSSENTQQQQQQKSLRRLLAPLEICFLSSVVVQLQPKFSISVSVIKAFYGITYIARKS